MPEPETPETEREEEEEEGATVSTSPPPLCATPTPPSAAPSAPPSPLCSVTQGSSLVLPVGKRRSTAFVASFGQRGGQERAPKAFRRVEPQPHTGMFGSLLSTRRGGVKDRPDDHITPDTFANLPQTRLLNMLEDVVATWLKKQKRKKHKGEHMVGTLSALMHASRFQSIYPLIQPPIESLSGWIAENMRGEVDVYEEHGETMLALIRTEPEGKEEMMAWREQEMQEFLSTMPADRFTMEEERLRKLLLNYLAGWQHSEPPLLSDALNSNFDIGVELLVAKWAVLPRHLRLQDWVRHRMCQEIDVQEIGHGRVSFQFASAEQSACGAETCPD